MSMMISPEASGFVSLDFYHASKPFCHGLFVPKGKSPCHNTPVGQLNDSLFYSRSIFQDDLMSCISLHSLTSV